MVAATADGKPKVLLSYLLEALTPKESRMREPWKSSDAREKMFLMKLRVFETPRQVAAFGWSTMQREVIPPDQDRDTYFPQYVPVREVCTQPEFCVTWVRKVSVQSDTSSRKGRSTTIEHWHTLWDVDEGVGGSIQLVPGMGWRAATSGSEGSAVEVQVHRIQERVCTVSRSQVLQTIAVLCMRALGTLGVQLWDPGRAIVCIALPDLGSVEGCGGDGLSVRGE